MPRRTFEHNGLTITVHARNGYDELDQDVIAVKLGDPTELALNYRVRVFARIITQTDTVEGDLGIALPNATSTPNELQEAMDVLFLRTDRLVPVWRDNINEVDKAPGEPDFAPAQDDDQADEKKDAAGPS